MSFKPQREVACRTLGDCLDGDLCVADRCRAQIWCGVDLDCPVGDLCHSLEQICIPVGVCLSDEDCPLPESCVSGQCQ